MKKFVVENWKQALMSIAIGACIAFITELAKGMVHFLQSIPTEPVAAGGGMLHYIIKHIKIG